MDNINNFAQLLEHGYINEAYDKDEVIAQAFGIVDDFLNRGNDLLDDDEYVNFVKNTLQAGQVLHLFKSAYHPHREIDKSKFKKVTPTDKD